MEDISPRPTVEPAYLGDGCYVEFDGFQLWLYTSDGLSERDRIALNRATYHALTQYAARLGFYR